MQHADLMDVFRAFSGAASPFLQQETAKLKERNDLELNDLDASTSIILKDYIRDNPYNPPAGGDPAAMAKYNAEYGQSLKNVTGREYDLAKERNTSPYFTQNADRMQAQSDIVLGGYVLEREDAYRAEQENVSLEADLKNYLDAGWDPQRTISAMNNRIDLSKTRREIRPEEETRLRQAAARAAFEGAATNALAAQTDVNGLEEALRAVRESFGFMPKTAVTEYDAEGKETRSGERPWAFNGQREWEKDLVEGEMKRIQGERGAAIQAEQGYFERLIVSGDIEGAIAFAKDRGANLNRRYYNPESPEYLNLSNEQRGQFGNYFDWQKLEEMAKTRAGALAATFEFNAREFLMPQLNGDGTVRIGSREYPYETVQDAMEGYIGFQKSAFYLKNGDKYSGPELDSQWAAEEADLLWDFNSTFKAMLKEYAPQTAEEFDKVEKFEKYLLDRDSDYYSREFERMDKYQRDKFVQNCILFGKDILWNGVLEPADFKEQVRNFISGETARVLEWRSTPGNEGRRIQQLAEFSARALSQEAEDVVFTDAQGRERWRNEEQHIAAEQVRETERQVLADIMGLPLSALQPGWSRSGSRKNDIIPKGQFVLKPDEHPERRHDAGAFEGAEPGTYRLDYDGSENMVVQKLNDDTGEWDTVRTRQRSLTEEEGIRQIMERVRAGGYWGR